MTSISGGYSTQGPARKTSEDSRTKTEAETMKDVERLLAREKEIRSVIAEMKTAGSLDDKTAKKYYDILQPFIDEQGKIIALSPGYRIVTFAEGEKPDLTKILDSTQPPASDRLFQQLERKQFVELYNDIQDALMPVWARLNPYPYCPPSPPPYGDYGYNREPGKSVPIPPIVQRIPPNQK